MSCRIFLAQKNLENTQSIKKIYLQKCITKEKINLKVDFTALSVTVVFPCNLIQLKKKKITAKTSEKSIFLKYKFCY